MSSESNKDSTDQDKHSVIGFSTGGVLAGSAASTAQATMGNVVAGGVFATLQSIGAVGGLSTAATGAATAAGAAVGARAGVGAAIPTSGETDDSNCPRDSDEG